MNDISISVVIPVYNEEDYLVTCLDSIADQKHPILEVVVVDNGSTDKSAMIAKSYPFVKLVSEPRRGVVFARNRGFDEAQGTIIGRIDADCILPSDWSEKIARFYSDPHHAWVAWSSSAYLYNVRAKRLFGWAHHLLIFKLNRLLMGSYVVWGSNMALPKELWIKVRPKVCHQQDIHEDIDLAIHVIQSGHKVVYQKDNNVGAELRRVRSGRKKLWHSLQWWPRTLKMHNYSLWPICWLIGAGMVYALSGIPSGLESLARLSGRRPL